MKIASALFPRGVAPLVFGLAAALAGYALLRAAGADVFPSALAGAIAGGWTLGRLMRRVSA